MPLIFSPNKTKIVAVVIYYLILAVSYFPINHLVVGNQQICTMEFRLCLNGNMARRVAYSCEQVCDEVEYKLKSQEATRQHYLNYLKMFLLFSIPIPLLYLGFGNKKN